MKLYRMVLHNSDGAYSARVLEKSLPLLNTITTFKVCRVTVWGIGCCPVRRCLVGSPSGLDDNLCGQCLKEQLPHSNIIHRNTLTAWIFAVCFLFLPLWNLHIGRVIEGCLDWSFFGKGEGQHV